MKTIQVFTKVIIAITYLIISIVVDAKSDLDVILMMGNSELSSDDPESAADHYLRGISKITEDDSLITILSLYTNLGTAYSMFGKNEEKVIEAYQNAILQYSDNIDEIIDDSWKKEASDITAKAAFFLALTYEDLGKYEKAIDAYSLTNSLDPNHWGSLANHASILHDHMRQFSQALDLYNQAYNILTSNESQPTDPPDDPKYILSQLQYRIGLALTYAENQKCVMMEDKSKEVSCNEMAASAFNLAISLDPENEAAKHMLATVTADATMSRASNSYITQLFEDYASNFEHSLVQELGYNGFQRLRLAFDKAFGGVDKVPKFDLVVDAGCGTGLAGEQFRNISNHMIGADLSPAIIEEAKQKRPNLYDETFVGDCTSLFRNKKDTISLIIAADSYIYFGDLVPLFQAMEEGLTTGGFIAFTLENVSKNDEERLETTKSDWRWQLTPSGRFAHRRKYVEETGLRHSLRTIHYEEMDGFRREGANSVRGHIFVMMKEGKDSDL